MKNINISLLAVTVLLASCGVLNLLQEAGYKITPIE